jgi:hypothetical protein
MRPNQSTSNSNNIPSKDKVEQAEAKFVRFEAKPEPTMPTVESVAQEKAANDAITSSKSNML